MSKRCCFLSITGATTIIDLDLIKKISLPESYENGGWALVYFDGDCYKLSRDDLINLKRILYE